MPQLLTIFCRSSDSPLSTEIPQRYKICPSSIINVSVTLTPLILTTSGRSLSTLQLPFGSCVSSSHTMAATAYDNCGVGRIHPLILIGLDETSIPVSFVDSGVKWGTGNRRANQIGWGGSDGCERLEVVYPTRFESHNLFRLSGCSRKVRTRKIYRQYCF